VLRPTAPADQPDPPADPTALDRRADRADQADRADPVIAGRSAVLVDLGAISRNVARIAAGTGTPVMAVVKADGYGHGLLPAARAAVAGGAAWLATAFVEEALALRAGGIDTPLLALVVTPADELEEAAAAGIELTVGSVAVLSRVPAGARVQLEFDSGLSRGGAAPAEWPELVRAAAAARVEVTGIWSHLACADEPAHPANARQLAAFTDALATAAAHGVRPPLRHLANSAAALTNPAARFDVVRIGIAAYGVAPGPEVPATGLEPAMSLVSHLAKVKTLAAGEGVSYGHTYTTPVATTVGLVPLGYGDGIPRHASGSGEVWVAGRRRPIRGRVCMDQFVVDLGDTDVAEGTPVTVFGPGPAPSADEWAEAAGTIGYEIVTRVGARVPRQYTGGADPDPGHDPTAESESSR
jgi:alanine racemase